MHYDIKNKFTYFDGTLFRSRLESRWAEFFARWEIDYLYEPIAVKIDKAWYSPDFYIPELNIFLEIKPPNYEGIALRQTGAKCFYCEVSSGIMTVVIVGVPDSCRILHWPVMSNYIYDSDMTELVNMHSFTWMDFAAVIDDYNRRLNSQSLNGALDRLNGK